MVKKKETTLDDLAAMVQVGFVEVHERLDKIDGTLAYHGERLNKIDGTLVGHGERLNKIDGTLTDHGERLEKIEYGIDLLKLSIKDIRTEIAHLTTLVRESTNPKEITQLKQRVTILEAELAKR